MIAALIDTPIEPITPTRAMMPKGYWNIASDSSDRPMEQMLTSTVTPVRRQELNVNRMVASRADMMRPKGSMMCSTTLARSSLSPP